MVMNYALFNANLHMIHHYRRVKSATSVVDTSPPKYSIKRNYSARISTSPEIFSSREQIERKNSAKKDSSRSSSVPSRPNTRRNYNVMPSNYIKTGHPRPKINDLSKKIPLKSDTPTIASRKKTKSPRSVEDKKGKDNINSNENLMQKNFSSIQNNSPIHHKIIKKEHNVATPRLAAAGTDFKKLPTAQDCEYLQFSLRITEDIIRNDLYSPKQMRRVFNSHIEANRGRLKMSKMLLQIDHLCKELDIAKKTLNKKCVELVCTPSCDCHLKGHSDSDTDLASQTTKQLVKKICDGHVITDQEINELSESELQDVISEILNDNEKSDSETKLDLILNNADNFKSFSDEHFKNMSETSESRSVSKRSEISPVTTKTPSNSLESFDKILQHVILNLSKVVEENKEIFKEEYNAEEAKNVGDVIDLEEKKSVEEEKKSVEEEKRSVKEEQNVVGEKSVEEEKGIEEVKDEEIDELEKSCSCFSTASETKERIKAPFNSNEQITENEIIKVDLNSFDKTDDISLEQATEENEEENVEIEENAEEYEEIEENEEENEAMEKDEEENEEMEENDEMEENEDENEAIEDTVEKQVDVALVESVYVPKKIEEDIKENVDKIAVCASPALPDCCALHELEKSSKEEAIIQQDISKEEAIIQRDIPKEEAISQHSIPKEEAISQKSIPKEEAISQKSIPKEEAISQKSIPKEEAISQKSIPKEEAISQQSIPKEEAISQQDTSNEEVIIQQEILNEESDSTSDFITPEKSSDTSLEEITETENKIDTFQLLLSSKKSSGKNSKNSTATSDLDEVLKSESIEENSEKSKIISSITQFILDKTFNTINSHEKEFSSKETSYRSEEKTSYRDSEHTSNRSKEQTNNKSKERTSNASKEQTSNRSKERTSNTSREQTSNRSKERTSNKDEKQPENRDRGEFDFISTVEQVLYDNYKELYGCNCSENCRENKNSKHKSCKSKLPMSVKYLDKYKTEYSAQYTKKIIFTPTESSGESDKELSRNSSTSSFCKKICRKVFQRSEPSILEHLKKYERNADKCKVTMNVATQCTCNREMFTRCYGKLIHKPEQCPTVGTQTSFTNFTESESYKENLLSDGEVQNTSSGASSARTDYSDYDSYKRKL